MFIYLWDKLYTNIADVFVRFAFRVPWAQCSNYREDRDDRDDRDVWKEAKTNE